MQLVFPKRALISAFTWHPVSEHTLRKNRPPSNKWNFQLHFHVRKLLYFIFVKLSVKSPVNCRRQAIIWTHDGVASWCQYHQEWCHHIVPLWDISVTAIYWIIFMGHLWDFECSWSGISCLKFQSQISVPVTDWPNTNPGNQNDKKTLLQQRWRFAQSQHNFCQKRSTFV